MDNNLAIKVGDFGLSRDMTCPVKWMPPEMLRDGISTEKSDVVCYLVYKMLFKNYMPIL